MRVRNGKRDNRGQAFIEYVLVIGVIVVGVIMAGQFFFKGKDSVAGGLMKKALDSATNTIQDPAANGP